ncbi:hypothetical protein JNW98_30750, partial [Streptomyces sp. SCA2-4]|nr:hypothetical protein [Streptomyces huiliensis]
MSSRSTRDKAGELLGRTPLAAAGWCSLAAIPKPPKDVHVAAGRGRLRPGRIGVLTVLGAVAASPLMLLALGYAALEWAAETFLGPILRTPKERAAHREEKRAEAEVRRIDAERRWHRERAVA